MSTLVQSPMRRLVWNNAGVPVCHGLMLHHLHQPAWWAETTRKHTPWGIFSWQPITSPHTGFLPCHCVRCVCVCVTKGTVRHDLTHWLFINQSIVPIDLARVTTIPLGFSPQQGWCIHHSHNHSHHRQSYFHHIPHTLRGSTPVVVCLSGTGVSGTI